MADYWDEGLKKLEEAGLVPEDSHEALGADHSQSAGGEYRRDKARGQTAPVVEDLGKPLQSHNDEGHGYRPRQAWDTYAEQRRENYESDRAARVRPGSGALQNWDTNAAARRADFEDVKAGQTRPGAGQSQTWDDNLSERKALHLEERALADQNRRFDPRMSSSGSITKAHKIDTTIGGVTKGIVRRLGPLAPFAAGAAALLSGEDAEAALQVSVDEAGALVETVRGIARELEGGDVGDALEIGLDHYAGIEAPEYVPSGLTPLGQDALIRDMVEARGGVCVDGDNGLQCSIPAREHFNASAQGLDPVQPQVDLQCKFPVPGV